MFKDSEITKSEGTGHPLKFTDAGAIPAWARTSVGAAVAMGIVASYPDNTFQPDKPVTRAEAAAMVYRLLNALENR